MASSVVIGALDKLATMGTKIRRTQQMTYLISDKICTYSLIFSIIFTCTTYGQYTDSEMGWLSLKWCAVFFVDFISSWFKHFSLFMAGPRTGIVSNWLEQKILMPKNYFFGQLCMNALTDLWLMQHVMIYSVKHPALIDGTQQYWFPPLLSCTTVVAYYRILVQTIEIKQAWLRIIDLDCEIYNKNAK